MRGSTRLARALRRSSGSPTPFSIDIRRRPIEAGILLILVVISIFALTGTVFATFSACPPPLSSPPSNGSEGGAERGAVASMDARCSRVGLDMLNLGGNAADAAIAAEFCLSVIGLHLTGISGGAMMLVRAADGRIEYVDFRETAPAASTQDMFVNNVNASLFGGLASGVPGMIRGLEHLHTKYASLPWSTLIEPAIHYARQGFVIGQDLAGHIATASRNGPFLTPAWAPDFAPEGSILGLGDTLKRERYADTLEAIRDGGPDAFYSGRIAETMIDAVAAAGGILTLEDLTNYKVAIRKPSVIDYGDFRLYGASAPAGGIVALSILNIFQGFPDVADPATINLTTHRLDEAMRFGYGMRTKLGDPDYADGTNEFQRKMLSEDTASDVRGLISDDETLPPEVYNPDGIESLETPGTSQLSVSDASGLTISLTSTINLLFGSYIMVPETGIIMNNEMNDFSIPGSSTLPGFRPSEANYIRPGKRPLSSMNPIIVTHAADDSFYSALGASGSSRIITSVVQVVWYLLDRGMNIYDAVREPRFHEQLMPNQTSYEWEYNNATRKFMEDRGHVTAWLQNGSSVQVVRRRENGTFEAAGEPRQRDSGGFAV